ncbi:MAG: hypothetical protein LBP26_05695 [Clostridiales bacterium]|jgi:membrane-bound ClpP family serine protease|nr:hypothetical protein [Clostridiales bacterium]
MFLDLGQAFTELFALMTLPALFCTGLGLMFVIIEFFQTTGKLSAAGGTVLIAAGIALRMIAGPSAGALFWMLFIITVVLTLAHTVVLITQKRDWLLHSLTLALSGGDVPGGKSGYAYLKNLTGVASTDIDPTGHITVNDVNFFVFSIDPIKKGSRVSVSAVTDERIYVEQIIE